MGIVITMNRRTALLIAFVVVFFCWSGLHNLITGKNNYDWPEFILLLCVSFASGYSVSRRFPPMGRQL